MPPFHIYIYPVFRNKSGLFLTGSSLELQTPVKKPSFFVHEGLAMQFGLQLSFNSKQILGSKLQVFRDRMIAALGVRLRDLVSGQTKPFERGL